jgi:hypothetical protein
MIIELSAKGLSIPAKIDALLKFPYKSGGEGLNMNSSVAQFKGEEKMVFW